MRLSIYFILCYGITHLSISPLQAQNTLTRPGSEDSLDQMSAQLTQLYHDSRELWYTILEKETRPAEANRLWDAFLYDSIYHTDASNKNYSLFAERGAEGFDVGLKWITEGTHNFRTGISENEDVYFRSRIATGLDWVLLGEGSWKKRRDDHRYFVQQLKRDSLRGVDVRHQYSHYERQEFLSQIFDQYRLSVLKALVSLRKNEADFQTRMFEHQLIDYPAELSSKQAYRQAISWLTQLQDVVDPAHAKQLKGYEKIAAVELLFLPTIENRSSNWAERQSALIQVEQDLHEMQAKRQSNDGLNFRTRLRYNYYTNPGQQERGFASVGATLSIPIRTGRKTDELRNSYLLQEKEQQLVMEQERHRFQVRDLQRKLIEMQHHKRKMEDELEYLEAAIQQQMEIQEREAKEGSPTEFIKLADNYLSTLLIVIDQRQSIAELYLQMHYLGR